MRKTGRSIRITLAGYVCLFGYSVDSDDLSGNAHRVGILCHNVRMTGNVATYDQIIKTNNHLFFVKSNKEAVDHGYLLDVFYLSGRSDGLLDGFYFCSQGVYRTKEIITEKKDRKYEVSRWGDLPRNEKIFTGASLSALADNNGDESIILYDKGKEVSRIFGPLYKGVFLNSKLIIDKQIDHSKGQMTLELIEA